MALDTTLLQVLKHRKDYERLHRVVNSRSVDGRTKVLIKDFGRYFDQVEDCDTIPVTAEFLTWFSMVAHRTLTEDDLTIYRRLFEKIEADPPPETKSMLVSSLLEADLAVRLADAVTAYDDEQDIDLPSVLRQTIEQFDMDVVRKVKLPLVEADDTLFDDDTNNTGFRWRWDAMNRTTRPLRPGDFVIMAGRPDKGKTTAISDNVTYMVPQLGAVYGEGHGRSVLWLNNEGPGSRILKRCVQSALGKPTSELVKLQEKGTLWKDYASAIGGDQHALKVYNIHGMKSWQVEEIFRQVKPGLVVFDMIDNVNFDGAVMNGGTRTDQLLEGMYQWARELAVRFDCPIIASSQISADGDGVAYPTLSMLKDSKCFAAGTMVRMYDGSTNAIETLSVGDKVMGIDGTARNVVGTGSGHEPMYRVSGKGWSFDCNESHNLVVQNNTTRRTLGLDQYEIRDLSLRKFMALGSSADRLTAVRCAIPYEEKDLPMEPYLFGLWLGDGAQGGCRITSGDPEILAYLEALPSYRSTYQQASNCADVYFGPRKWLDYMGVRNNKHIPKEYKTSSKEQRLALLAGIMDSDGTRDHGSCCVSMSNKRQTLIDDIEDVARSLGYRVSQRTKESTQSVSVTFANTDDLPVLLAHKAGVCKSRGDRMTVEPLGYGKYYGITVDGDSRYCHAKYIALRNTGKQGTADLIITVGAKNEPGFESLRFIGATKNKLALEGQPQSPKAELVFDGPAGRYVEG